MVAIDLTLTVLALNLISKSINALFELRHDRALIVPALVVSNLSKSPIEVVRQPFKTWE
jgi:hypothetical protein